MLGYLDGGILVLQTTLFLLWIDQNIKNLIPSQVLYIMVIHWNTTSPPTWMNLLPSYYLRLQIKIWHKITNIIIT